MKKSFVRWLSVLSAFGCISFTHLASAMKGDNSLSVLINKMTAEFKGKNLMDKKIVDDFVKKHYDVDYLKAMEHYLNTKSKVICDHNYLEKACDNEALYDFIDYSIEECHNTEPKRVEFQEYTEPMDKSEYEALVKAWGEMSDWRCLLRRELKGKERCLSCYTIINYLNSMNNGNAKAYQDKFDNAWKAWDRQIDECREDNSLLRYKNPGCDAWWAIVSAIPCLGSDISKDSISYWLGHPILSIRQGCIFVGTLSRGRVLSTYIYLTYDPAHCFVAKGELEEFIAWINDLLKILQKDEKSSDTNIRSYVEKVGTTLTKARDKVLDSVKKHYDKDYIEMLKTKTKTQTL